MNKVIKYLLLLSALIPATILLIISFWVIVKVLNGKSMEEEDISYLIMSVLGILGYIGLIKLALNFADKPDKWVLFFLIAGVASFAIFNGMGGMRAWKWVLSMEEPGEWFLLVWPTIVSIVFIIRTSMSLARKNTQMSE